MDACIPVLSKFSSLKEKERLSDLRETRLAFWTLLAFSNMGSESYVREVGKIILIP